MAMNWQRPIKRLEIRVVTTCLLALVAALHGAKPATAAPKAKAGFAAKEGAREASLLTTRAKAAFKAGEFDEAARLFMKAYALSGEAAQVFNAARAYEEAGKVGDAVGLFRLYTTLADDPDGIADARERIRKLEAGRLGGKPTDPTASGSSTSPAVPDASRPGESARDLALGATPTVQAQAQTNRNLLWIAAGTAGAAAVGGAALLALGAAASRDANAIQVRSAGDIDRYNAAFDEAERLRSFGWASVGLAAVAGGAAAWLWLRQPVAVAADPRGGLTLIARF